VGSRIVRLFDGANVGWDVVGDDDDGFSLGVAVGSLVVGRAVGWIGYDSKGRLDDS
jgi:hypothetical protein